MRCNLAVIKRMWHTPLVQYQGSVHFPHTMVAINRLNASHPEWLLHEHIVFAGYDHEWQAIDRQPIQGIYIAASKDITIPEYIQDDASSWLVIREPLSIDEVIYKIDDILTHLSLWEENLLQMFVMEAEVTHVLNHCRELLHNPLYLLDTSMNMIGYSDSKQPHEFDKWLEEFSKPEGKKKVFENERKYDILNLLANSRKSIQISLPVDVFPFVSSTIYEGDEKMAVLGCVGCDQEMICEDAAMMDFIKDRVSTWIIQLIRKRDNADSHLQGIVRNILIGKSVSDTVMLECAKQMKIYEKKFRMIRIHLPHDIYTSLKDYIWNEYREIFTNIWQMEVDGDLIFFIPEKDFSDFMQEKMVTALEFGKKYDIRICASLPMDSLRFADRQYRWMDWLVSLDIDPERIFTGEEFFEEVLLQNCMIKNNPEQFCHPQILKIQEHDRQTGSSWLLTLETYLDEERSLVGAARKLNIHRNTLIYRLQQINDMTGLDFNDGKIRRICMISCAILKNRGP